MHYSLILVGAHDGSKTLQLIQDCAQLGKVLLVEPVPFLFERLKGRVGGLPNVVLENVCLAAEDGMVQFSAPTAQAAGVVGGADQLGSLNPGHAAAHFPQLAEHFEIVPVEARCFDSLLAEHRVGSLSTLITDTEGFDCDLLETFPFERLLPDTVVFEFKHSDGVFRVGRKLARLLGLLDERGYHVSVLDAENMIARQSARR